MTGKTRQPVIDSQVIETFLTDGISSVLARYTVSIGTIPVPRLLLSMEGNVTGSSPIHLAGAAGAACGTTGG